MTGTAHRGRRGQRIGEWRLEHLLGEGAFGTTWRARGRGGAAAAVKLLAEAPGGELLALRGVCHPAIPALLGAGSEPIPHLVMELARGRPLDRLLEGGILDLDLTTRIACTLLDGLRALHHAGIRHGDIKPSNLVVAPDGRARIVDFGMAGGTGGTLAYAAPEAVRGQPVAASDVYGAGLTIWEMLHGELPNAALPAAEALSRRAAGVDRATQGPAWLAGLLERMLEPNPELRLNAASALDVVSVKAGMPLEGPDAEMIGRRARSAFLERPDAPARILRWSGRGALAISGPPGSGKSQQLEALAAAHLAKGGRLLRIISDGRPWSGVQSLLPPGDGARGPVAAARVADLTVDALVLADDFESLDVDSAATLGWLARAGRSIVCAGNAAPPWAREHLALRPFDLSETRALVDRALGAECNAEPIAERLQALGGGLPGRSIALLQQALKTGALHWRRGRWALDTDLLHKLEPVASDLPEFPAACLPLARILAAHPGALTLDEVRALDDRALDGLEGLVEQGLAVPTQDGVRARSPTALRELAGTVDPELHLQIAGLLAARPHVAADRIAVHLLEGGDLEGAARWGASGLANVSHASAQMNLSDRLWAAGLHPGGALLRVRILEAAGRTREAVDLAEEHVHEDPLPLLAVLARIQAGVRGDIAAAQACLERAGTFAEADDDDELTLARATVAFRAEAYEEALAASPRSAPPKEPAALDIWLRQLAVRAQAMQARGQLEAAIEELEGLDPHLGQGSPARALVDAVLGRLLWFAGRIRSAGKVLERGGRPDSGLPVLDRARSTFNSGAVWAQLGDRVRALAVWEDSALLFERLEAQPDQVRVDVNLCLAYREAGRWEAARTAGTRAHRRAMALGMHEQAAMAAGNMGDLWLARRDSERACLWFRATEELAQAHGLKRELAELARRRAELAALDDQDDLTALAEEAIEMARATEQTGERCRAEILAALGRQRSGHPVDLASVDRHSLTPLRQAGLATDLARARLWMAELALRIEEGPSARQYVDEVLAYAREVEHVEILGQALALDGEIEETRGIEGKLGQILELAALAASDRPTEALLAALAEGARALLGADRAFLIDAAGEELSRSEGAQGSPSRSIVERSMDRGREVVALDIGERNDLAVATSISHMALRSALSVPLRHEQEILGVLYVDSRSASNAELHQAIGLMRAVASYAVGCMLRSRERERAEQRMQREAESQARQRIAEELRAVNQELTHRNQELGKANLALEEALQRAKSAEKARARFVAAVTHELRTPLNGILGMAQLIGASPLHEEQAEHLEHLNQSGQRLLDLVDKILTYTRLEGHQEARLAAPMELRPVVDEVLRLATALPDAAGLEISSAWSGDAPAKILADPDGLRRILTNLVGNAVRYTDRGQVSVRVTGDASQARIAVVDSGVGIPEEERESIFQPFVRAAETRGGTGLGLAISRRLARQMGGDVHMDTSSPEGSTFVVTLPLPRELPDRFDLHVLIVEDNHVNQRVLEAMLKRLGCTSRVVSNGRGALTAMDEEAFDLVLSDLQMPGMDGLELSERIRERPDAPTVMAVTAEDLPVRHRACHEAGMVHVLTKPLDLRALARALKSL